MLLCRDFDGRMFFRRKAFFSLFPPQQAVNRPPYQASLVTKIWFFIFSAPILNCNKRYFQVYSFLSLSLVGVFFFCLFLQNLYYKIKVTASVKK